VEAFFVSAGLVAIAEIGDKTQLLAIILATRYRKPLPIILGILTATLANHTLAAWVGAAVADWLGPQTMRWVLAVLFLAMAAWCLIPDKMDDKPKARSDAGAYLATTIAFFLVEIGDKTQIATAALAARFHGLAPVVAGTTLGMLLADVPAVFLGDVLSQRLSLNLMRAIAAAGFAALGLVALLLK
jgi:putative Ca2+/H+ antiporter (TMEM165/GDT1 family)